VAQIPSGFPLANSLNAAMILAIMAVPTIIAWRRIRSAVGRSTRGLHGWAPPGRTLSGGLPAAYSGIVRQ
jgi:hypothetical protein